MSSLVQVSTEGLPTELVKAIEEALNTESLHRGTLAETETLLRACSTMLERLSELGLSAYASEPASSPEVHEEVLATCRLNASIGTKVALLETLRKAKDSPAVRNVLSLMDLYNKNVEGVRRFCEAWDLLTQRWEAADEPESIEEYGSVVRLAKGESKYKVLQCLHTISTFRNAIHHYYDGWNFRKKGPIKLSFNRDFYSTINPLLQEAIASLLEHLAHVLTKYLSCSVEDDRQVDDGSGRVIRVKVDWRNTVLVPLANAAEHSPVLHSRWFLTMPDRELCFPLVTPLEFPNLQPRAVVKRTTTRAAVPSQRRLRSPKFADLEAEVWSGRFTPVLGPGCAKVESNLSLGRAHVEERVKLLRKVFADSSAEGRYLKSMLATRFGEAKRLKSSQPDPPRSWEADQLVDLQIHLVRMAVSLTGAFAASVTDQRPPVVDVGNFAVRLTRETWDAQGQPHLNNAIDAADELVKVANDPELGLAPVGIRDRLRVLSSCMPVRGGEVLLPLSLLEWLGDVIWHTLRFGAPMYPTSDELTVQLSLSMTAEPNDPLPRRHPIGAMTYALERSSLVEKLTAWNKAWQRESLLGDSPFYEAIARALLHASSRVTKPTSVGAGSSGKAVGGMPGFTPVALDTTFDDGLIRIFRRERVPHHVVFPVRMRYRLTGAREAGAQQQSCWLLYSSDGPSWTYLPSQNQVPDDNPQGLDVQPLSGPVIAKLNGAPLTELPRPGCLDGIPYGMTDVRFEHRLIVSYRDVMAVVGTEAALPPGLIELLQVPPGTEDQTDDLPPRSLCLLGFTLTDSNSRLRVYDFSRPEDPSGQLAPDADSWRFPVVLVDSPRDPVNHAFLGLDNYLLEATLEQVAQKITDIGRLQPLPSVAEGV